MLVLVSVLVGLYTLSLIRSRLQEWSVARAAEELPEIRTVDTPDTTQSRLLAALAVAAAEGEQR
ncbi:MAG: hypothetical protein AAGG11_22480 [Pseudomonadota bacterium]